MASLACYTAAIIVTMHVPWIGSPRILYLSDRLSCCLFPPSTPFIICYYMAGKFTKGGGVGRWEELKTTRFQRRDMKTILSWEVDGE